MNTNNNEQAGVMYRLHAPLIEGWCMATDYVRRNGKRSFQPVHEVKVRRIEDLAEVNGILEINEAFGTEGEEGVINLILEPIKDDGGNVPANAIAYVGASNASLGIFKESVEAAHKSVRVGGSFGANTLNVIAQLALSGKCLKLDSAHFTADSSFFASQMLYEKFKHDGSSNGSERRLYPNASDRTENTGIKVMPNLNVTLDGTSYLKIPVGGAAKIQFKTTFLK